MASTRKKKSRGPSVRLVVQIFFLVVIAVLAVNHTLAEDGGGIPFIGEPSLHSVCPFGGVVSIYQFATTGTFARKIHESAFVLMIIVLVVTVFFGPVFCGWVCPMGTVQELVSKIGRRIFPKRHNKVIPYGIDRYLRYLRYVVLAWVVYVTARSGQLIFADYDPYYALFNFWTGEVAVSALIVLAVTLLGSLVVERPFCKYACPYGALLGVFNLFRVFGIKRNTASCISCAACDKACPMNIQVSKAGTVRNHQCISCLECTSENACPVSSTVEMGAGRFGIEKVEV